MTTTRSIAAANDGPVTIDATLLGHGGRVTVHAEAGCKRATLTISTPDESGPAADAVRDAALKQHKDSISARIEGHGGISSGGTIVTGGGHRMQFTHNSGVIIGGNSVVGNVVNGSDVVIVGGRVVSGGNVVSVGGSSPIEVTATVPQGSSVAARTQSADVDTFGSLKTVGANTQSGDVRVGRAGTIEASTQSGDIRLERTDVVTGKTMSGDITIGDFGGTAKLNTMSGDIRVHATAGGNLAARTMSGDIDVTATDAALADDLDVQTSSMSGRVRTPRPRPGTTGVRRRR
ncbi:hypothetical protein E4198_00115 [Streptomyces sp. RKND-216]|uniref:DUF4097 family beta strand repeat-containing protein n=1 Tax=Streptomyces sp. RKND-216 TaxID=2562581 RepID=UPI00109DAE5E|nr:DUF4097 family beta strand repeat-containing protein [Streptomyces sp. RKND-216]THA28254.1 hypothetical protein E4198_00115 [Streptomyces sp. RKND-216]